MIIKLLQPLGLLLSLSLILAFIFNYFERKKNIGKILSGIAYGILSVIAMMTPYDFIPGFIFDSRSVIISLSGFFGGVITATPAILIGAAYRLHLGGGGALAGALVVVIAGSIGIITFHLRNKYDVKKIPVWHFLFFGYVTHFISIFGLAILPSEVMWNVIKKLSIPFFGIYPFLTVFLGIIIHQIELHFDSKIELKSSQDKYEQLYNKLKNSQEELQHSLTNLNQVVRAGRVGLWDWNLITNKVNYSAEWKKQIGYEEHELTNDYSEWETRVHPDDLDSTIADVQQSIKDINQNHQGEFRFRHKDGSYKWILAEASFILNDDGKPIKMMGSHVDITDRKRSEEALRVSEEKFYKAFNLNPSTLAIIDLETKQRLAVNDRFSELVGYSKKELIENPLGALGEIDMKMVDMAISTIKQGGSLKDIEVKLKNKNGNEKLMLYTVEGIEVDNRSCMIVSGKDITERKRIEKALLSSEHRYRNLFQKSPIPLWEEDFTEVFKYIDEHREKGVHSFREYIDTNPSFIEQCGQKVRILDVNQETLKLHHAKTKEELLGNLDKIFTEKSFETFKEEIITLSQGLFEFESEGEVKTLSGKKRKIYLKMIVEKESQGSFMALIATIDITDRHQMEERLMHAQKMESIGSLAGGIAHDFNNLLFPIIGMSEMLLEDLSKDSIEYENASEIYQAGKRAGDLVQQILAFSRQSEHKMTPVRVQNVLKEVLKLSRSTIPSNIDIHQNIRQNCGLIMADPTQIHQVAMNLITNAFHAVEDKNGAIDIELEETILQGNEWSDSVLKSGQYVKLSVSDNGIGISKDSLHKIFEPYFTTKERGKGTGLGLSVVYGIVKEHKGDIKVYSELGKGTTFSVYLPLMEKATEPVSTKQTSELETGTERILLVDDEVSVAKLEEQLLSRLGYQVTAETSSREALNVFRSKPEFYDLVISDMTMPDMTGDRLSKEILSIKQDTPIIICTGFSERINQEQAMMLGVKGFLMKPVVKSDMAQMVRKVLDESKNV